MASSPTVAEDDAAPAGHQCREDQLEYLSDENWGKAKTDTIDQ